MHAFYNSGLFLQPEPDLRYPPLCFHHYSGLSKDSCLYPMALYNRPAIH